MDTKTKISAGASVILLIATIVMSAGLAGQKNVYACADTQIAMVSDSSGTGDAIAYNYNIDLTRVSN